MSNATLVEELIGGLPLSTANPMPIIDSGSAPLGGGIIWGAPTAVAVTAGPTSTTLVVANAARKAISIWNPIGNAQMSVNIAGGAAVLVTGLPLLAGFSITLTGAECPVGAITFIGTAAQSLVYQQGT
tara:strand:+ start:1610 stop:1993 length:384 start_codon:yes stop_codon:yes gene_type:complete